MLQKLTLLFPLWMILAGAMALFWPEWLLPLNQGPVVVLILAFVMLCMGLTLTFDDFRRIARMPRVVAIGFVAQYSIMPLLAWGIAAGLDLPVHFAVGLILVGCCPGGTASNLVSYIAKADVALSVVMTVCSTLAAVILTPVLTQLFAGTLVPVDTWMLFKQTLQVVILPVVLGVFLNRWVPQLVQRVMPVAPLLSVLGVCVICAVVFAANAETILTHGGALILAVALLHGGGFLIGYQFARILGCQTQSARTISIEVGMQNSGLAIVLAKQAFPLLPLAPVVGAISVLMHSLVGSSLAALWRARSSRR
ncbi:MAG: bile acid:sodium symporter family protein [Nitrosomonas sp.]|uniref:bile acid:sodium symporter family protein n=1 Tax=Nitrosomonas sp. TaxID=42353 RepID=UPI00271A26A9|nr:bile acid:sodium symporter family protein [Nitrosomonas sp.]MDO8893810.1 bile acid:sodium symporter family protein [Nitrosomonas sp.]MDP2225266.1 bile acid:sodium symporter family protein [Nitrosomonas sp.]MDP3281649.1 bile acid:sodium symporter family protein [Nitrosomonas sp.]